MKCKISGCFRNADYKSQQVCQKHYFRMMRNGTYELTRSRKYRIQNPAGYFKVYEPDHILSDSRGYVYEHRFAYYEAWGDPKECLLCGDAIDWGTCHIDHKNNDVTDNRRFNLRAVCMPCNVFRGHTATSLGNMELTVGDKTMTPSAWARMPGVIVSHTTIRRRKLSGMSDYDAIYAPRKTHQNTKTKKKACKYDGLRGIG